MWIKQKHSGGNCLCELYELGEVEVSNVFTFVLYKLYSFKSFNVP